MYTQCPECLSVFPLDVAAIARAHGNVRCGYCTMAFDALSNLSGELPDDPLSGLPVHPSGAEPPLLSHPVLRPLADAALEAAAGIVTPRREAPHPPPDFARPRKRPVPMHNLRWMAGCAILALLLAVQLLVANRAALAADPSWRPMLARTCAVLSCTLPQVKDISRLTLLSRDIRPHPSVPGALIISATIRNDATFTQPYPVVRIALSDLDGNTIAMRRFRPADYVSDPKTRAAGLPPGDTVAAVFEVADPGKNAVAFEFGFE